MTPYDLPEPKGGGAIKLRAETYRAIVSMLRALWSGENVVGGANVLKRERADAGFSLSATGGGVGAAKDGSHPFKIILKAGPTPSTRLLNVLPGLVDGVFPTLDGDPLWTLPAPSVEITLPPIGRVRNVFIESVILAGRVTDPIIETALDNAMPEETDAASTHILGYITPTGSVVQLVKTSVAYQAYAIVFGVGGDRLVRHVYTSA
jgi:hypothetical protein